MPYNPHAHATMLSLEVHYQVLETCHGLYIPSRSMILLRPLMPTALERGVLAIQVARHLLGQTAGTSDAERMKLDSDAFALAMHNLLDEGAVNDSVKQTESILTAVYGDIRKVS